MIKSQYDLVYHDNTDQIVSKIKEDKPDVILLDFHIGEVNGINILKDIKMDDEIGDISVIMLTGEVDVYIAVECMKNHAMDYLIKGQFDKTLILKTLQYASEHSSMQKTIKEQQRQILELSRYDGLTGVANRRYFVERVEEIFRHQKRRKFVFSLIVIDLDYFKNINDKYGHLVGDKVLQSVSSVINENIRSTDLIGRYGGDEFVVLLIDYVERVSAETITLHCQKIDEIRSLFSEHKIEIPQGFLSYSATFGVAMYEDGVNNFHALFEQADKALYHAKRNGRDCIGYYLGGITHIYKDKEPPI